ncbi:hypothetical protein [Frateuria sp.]|uniref:hypothetical protein n=1 Tax=Frateuria sp. TaxID=2211372 RepID=UPI003F8232B9
MSKVDVIAVLDSAAAEVNCQCGHPRCSKQRERAEILKARAAEAELIEALRMGREIGDECSRGYLAQFYAKADAALAACTPAKEGGR